MLTPLWVELRHVAVSFGCWLRPHDMLANRRHWRWLPERKPPK